MLCRNGRKQLLRQSTCPAVITGKDSIPFCIPSYKNSISSLENVTDENGQRGRFRSAESYENKQALSLGAINKDLYLVDQYENQDNNEGTDGFFSSSSRANFPPDHVGRVWFALTYEESSEKLVLSLLKARNLKICQGNEGAPKTERSRKSCSVPSTVSYCENDSHKRSPSVRLKRKLFAMSRRHTSAGRKEGISRYGQLDVKRPEPIKSSPSPRQKLNSLVKIYLLPDERMMGQAKCKKQDVDPVFVDRFVFQISKSDVKSRSIRLVFVEVDDNMKHHVIGHITRPLWNFRMDGRITYDDLERGHPLNCKDSIDCIEAEIQVSMCYDSAYSRLTVILLRMKLMMPSERNLEIDQDIDLKFNVCGKPTKTKKCKTVRRKVGFQNGKKPCDHTEFPMNESFRFDLNPEEFDKACLIINVKSKTKRSANSSCVALGNYMFARGSALEHWTRTTNNPDKFIQSWHHLMTANDETNS
ncbi:synaptotagmin-15-like isoform X1 [Styela clava]